MKHYCAGYQMVKNQSWKLWAQHVSLKKPSLLPFSHPRSLSLLSPRLRWQSSAGRTVNTGGCGGWCCSQIGSATGSLRPPVGVRRAGRRGGSVRPLGTRRAPRRGIRRGAAPPVARQRAVDRQRRIRARRRGRALRGGVRFRPDRFRALR